MSTLSHPARSSQRAAQASAPLFWLILALGALILALWPEFEPAHAQPEPVRAAQTPPARLLQLHLEGNLVGMAITTAGRPAGSATSDPAQYPSPRAATSK